MSDELRRWPFEPLVREVVALLARGDYTALERRAGGVRLSAEDLERAVEEYGRTLVMPPPGTDVLLGVYTIAAADPPAWALDVALWTLEEGRSDLTLQLTVRRRSSAPGDYELEIDNLHVL